jgi:hypothetical protein
MNEDHMLHLEIERQDWEFILRIWTRVIVGAVIICALVVSCNVLDGSGRWLETPQTRESVENHETG